MSPEETAGSIEMAFGVWGAVGPSNHVLDGGLHLPMVRGNFGVISSPLKTVGIACSRVFSARRMIRAALWQKSQELFGELSVGFVIKKMRVRFPVRVTLCNNCGQVDFLATMQPFIELLQPLVIIIIKDLLTSKCKDWLT